MDRPCLLAFVEDFYFRSQIEAIARMKRFDPYFATQGEQLSQLAKTLAPFMMLADLSSSDSEWIFRHITELKATRPDFPIVVFIAPVQEDVRDRAERYGCDLVLSKSELIQKLPSTIDDILRKGI